MGKRLEWVKFNFTDWMIGVRRMTWSARGIYMEALCLQFHGERIPVGYSEWCELFPGITQQDYEQVAARFTMRSDTRGEYLINARLETEMGAVELRKDKAKAAAAQRWHPPVDASALRVQCLPNAIEKRGEEKRGEDIKHTLDQQVDLISASTDRDIVDLSAVAKRASSKPKMRLPEGALDRIWELFPKKVGKKSALALLDKAIRDYAKEWELDTLDDAAEWMRERVAVMAKRYDGTDEKFIPHPATWLRQGRYLDPVDAA